jgi:hypothetical protein
MLANLKDTSYQHVTDIDETTGEFHCDCSGLVSYVLRKELRAHYDAIPYPKPLKHPRAVEFCKTFEAAPAIPLPGQLWQRVARVADFRPGDVAAWRIDPPPVKGNTGHVVLIDSTPKQVSTDTWEVVVIDSTSLIHKDDTRPEGTTGVGRGTMYFKTDDEGRPISRATRSADGRFIASPIGVGRPVAPSNN